MTISLSFRLRPLASYRCQSTHGIDTRKFHGSFRIFFVLRRLCISFKRNITSAPYRYFNRFLVLYPNFSGSRQISLFEFSSRSVVSHTAHQTGLFLHRRRLFIADHKDPAFDLSMMIHCRALLTGSRLLHRNHSR